MRFDAYNGNVRGVGSEEVANIIAWQFKGKVERARPRGRYGDVYQVSDASIGVGSVGYDERLEAAFFEMKGERTPDAVEAIRKHWPLKHTISRVDACEDFDDAGALKRLVELVDRCKDPRVRSKRIHSRSGDDGETVYWGADTSKVRVRVYEAGKIKERRHFGRPDWVRLEAQIRPGKALEKVAASQMSPMEVWGFSRWSQKAAEEVAGVEVPRLVLDRLPPTFEKTTLYLARAYRRHFENMLEDFGDWQCIGKEFAAIWAHEDAQAFELREASLRKDDGERLSKEAEAVWKFDRIRRGQG